MRQKNRAIIRYISGLCKEKFKAFTDIEIFNGAYASFNVEESECPDCHAKKLEEFSYYTRWLIWAGKSSHIVVRRYVCRICGHTHALLPDIITPYSRYSLRFKLDAIVRYHNRTGSVEKLCAELKIAISTIYRWLKKLKEHKALQLGALADKETTVAEYVEGLLDAPSLSQILKRFFSNFNISFWQERTTHYNRHGKIIPRPP